MADHAHRSNAEWLGALGSEDGDPAVATELGAYLRRQIGKTLRERAGDVDVDELVQESLLQIVQRLPSFRGDSAFTTWAVAVATRVTFSHLRRRRLRLATADAFAEVRTDVEALTSPRTADPQEVTAGRQLLQALRAAIVSHLTERQRLAILAELRGVPTIEIAARLSTNTNALYKLVHDARRKLRAALEAEGYSADSLQEVALQEGS